MIMRGGIPPADPSEVLHARAADRLQRTSARRLGHTRPVVPYSKHAACPKLGEAAQRPKRRLLAKTSPANADMVWVKRLRVT